MTRTQYLVELQQTSRAPQYSIESFIRYALQGFVDELRDQINVIRDHQLDTTWENFVHDIFRNEETPAKRRQRHLVLDMPKGTVVPRGKLREVSNRVALEYAGKESKTVTRDINELLKRGLLLRVSGGFMSNRDAIKAFLPIKHDINGNH